MNAHVSEETVVAQLGAAGLTRNQALAYLTLLQDNSAEGLTGYEVGARSGVPRSAVYKVLRQLEEGGAAFKVGEEPQRFLAAEPDQWLDRVRRGTLSKLDTVSESLRTLPPRTRPEPVWIIRRYTEVMDRVREMISGAEHSVYLSLWRREVEVLAPCLAELEGRSVHRVLHCPEPLPSPPPGFHVWADQPTDPTHATWSHKAIVVVDRRLALIGGAEIHADNDAVSTSNPALVDVATNHIVLDITLMSQRTGVSCRADVAPMMRPHLS